MQYDRYVELDANRDHELGVGRAGGARVMIHVVHPHTETSVQCQEQETERIRPSRDGKIDLSRRGERTRVQ
jgi:hypothetical protein